MSYEWIKKVSGGRNVRVQGWIQFPAVAFTKHGITFNLPFLAAFGLRRGNRIMFGFDLLSRKLGIKILAQGDPVECGYKVQANAASLDGHTLNVACKGLVTTLPADCRGRSYRAQLNPGERVIEIDLTPQNELK